MTFPLPPNANFTDRLAYPPAYRSTVGYQPLMLGVARSSSTRNIFTSVLRSNSHTAPFSTTPLSTTLGSCRQMTVAASAIPNTTANAAATLLEEADSKLSTLETLKFNNTFTDELPGDPSQENRIRQVHGAFYSFVSPTSTGTEPTTLVYSKETARLVGIQPSECERPEFALVFSGNAPLPGSKPYAQCYGGHQFGMWAGQLGDGRAISLGEVENPNGTGSRYELQLKGAGPTPYSRRADGRAVLRSSIREYVASEAMFHLGVPTTRALSLVATGDQVVRDMFYNGNAQLEPGAVVCRVAQSFIRFGTFQLPASRGEDQSQLVHELADYVIKHFYPEVGSGNGKYVAFFKEVARRTAVLFAEWHRVGFVHGVLNTDNMSILGDTIDYGPYGFLERFDPDFTPNTTDLPGRRYCFKAQPEIGQFNLVQLALALVTAGLMTQEEASEALSVYGTVFGDTYEGLMAKKIGLKTYDKELSIGLMKEMYEDSADYTNTFRALSSVQKDGTGIPDELRDAVGPFESKEREAAWEAWLTTYRALLRAEGRSDSERKQLQDGVNPVIVPRNHVLVDIIGKTAEGDLGPLNEYLEALRTPYDAAGVNPAWLVPGPKQSRMGVELLSCSS